MSAPDQGEIMSTDAARAADESRMADDWRGLASARSRQGDAALEAGDLDRAEEHVRAALSLYLMLEDGYSAARTLSSLAQIRYEMGDYAEAIDLNLQASERLPGDAVALTGLAYAEWRAGSPSDAEATFSQVLRWDGDAAAALTGRGQVRAELRKYASALDDLDRALSLQLDRGTEADTRSARALALAGLGRTQEARAELAASFRLDPSRPRSRLRAGRIAALAGDRDEARTEIEGALDGQPTLPGPERDAAARLLARLNASLASRLAHRAGLSRLTSFSTACVSSRNRARVRLPGDVPRQCSGRSPQQILGIRLCVSGQVTAAGQMLTCSIWPEWGETIHPSGRPEERSLTSASSR
jgi:tetratricopeptide (TPR) repeat protein